MFHTKFLKKTVSRAYSGGWKICIPCKTQSVRLIENLYNIDIPVLWQLCSRVSFRKGWMSEFPPMVISNHQTIFWEILPWMPLSIPLRISAQSLQCLPSGTTSGIRLKNYPWIASELFLYFFSLILMEIPLAVSSEIHPPGEFIKRPFRNLYRCNFQKFLQRFLHDFSRWFKQELLREIISLQHSPTFSQKFLQEVFQTIQTIQKFLLKSFPQISFYEFLWKSF